MFFEWRRPRCWETQTRQLATRRVRVKFQRRGQPSQHPALIMYKVNNF